jgi:hypothetical protein
MQSFRMPSRRVRGTAPSGRQAGQCPSSVGTGAATAPAREGDAIRRWIEATKRAVFPLGRLA